MAKFLGLMAATSVLITLNDTSRTKLPLAICAVA